METKEKRREEPRQRKAVEERPKRPAAQRDARQAPHQTAAERDMHQDVRRTAAPQRRTRPAEDRREASARSNATRAAQSAASVQRPVRSAGEIRPSAPQGTGLRKSAPKMSAQETAMLRQKQRSHVPQQPQKKNALQNLISGIEHQDSPVDPAAKAELRRKQRAEKEAKKRKRTQRYDTPAVIYTQPQAFNRDRLLIQLLTVTAVVAALILGMSVFFKVKTITVAGAETYSTQAIQEASGIQEGDNLLTFSKARASAQIRAKLSYVDNIRIGIKLPDTVIIYVEELDVAYAIESSLGDWWLINSSGRVVEQITSNEASKHTQVLGVSLETPQPGNPAVAAEFVPEETLESGEPVPLTVTGAQRLSSALQILKSLEANDIVGEAASIEVSELEDITLWYGSRYEVMLGDTTRMDYKIACMNAAILQMSEYQSGILDVSFTNPNWIDQVGYTPFG